jgi:transcriptional regulator with XRE-family HTH domain
MDMERQKLIAARKARNLTQAQLADALNCSKAAIGLWERSEATPKDDMILALCTFFGKDAASLDLAEALSERKLKMIQNLLKNRTVDHRQALAIVTLPAFRGIDLSWAGSGSEKGTKV